MRSQVATVIRSLALCVAVCACVSAADRPQPLPAQPQAAGGAEVQKLKAQLAAQQEELRKLKQTIEEQQKAIEKITAAPEAKQAGAEPEQPAGNLVASTKPMVPLTVAKATPAAVPPSPAPRDAVPQPAEPPLSPLQLKVGQAYLTPVGFMDFTTVFRSTTVGSGIGTNFGSIPFSNTPQGKLTETRFSAQNSRVGFRVDAQTHGAKVLGYLEADFLGVTPGNLVVSSNSDSLRMRLYYLDVQKNGWEILGGQSWSLLTPGRKGLSPLPGSIYFSQNMDTNYQVGLVWSRNPQLRLVYHPSYTVAMGVSIENPEQYIGGSAGGGLVTLPSALASSLASQVDNGNSAATSNLHPDIIGKVAFDPMVGNRSLHLEVAGLLSSFRLYNPTASQHYTATGGGGSINVNYELVRGFRLISNNFWSDGGGRWLFGQAPDLVVRGDGRPSLVHAGSTVDGFEYTKGNTLVAVYYGGIYIGRNVTVDPATGKLVGYGFSGSSGGNNRAIQEGTIDLNRTIWKDAKWGAVNMILQYSYLTRNPWYVANGTPKNASSNMAFFDLRYTLPGAAPEGAIQ